MSQAPDDLSARYLEIAGQDRETLTFERDLGEARRLDEHEAFMGKMGEEAKSAGEQPGAKPASLLQEIESFAQRMPANVTKGVIDGADNTFRLLIGNEAVDAGDRWLNENLPRAITGPIDGFFKYLKSHDSASDKMTQELAKFTVPFMGYMRAFGAGMAVGGAALGVGQKVAQAIGADFMTSVTALDPHMERFAGLLQSVGLQSDFLAYVSDNENESDAEGRFKNAVDNAIGAGVAAPVIFAASSLLKAMWRGGREMMKNSADLAASKEGAEGGVLAKVGAWIKTRANK